MKLKMFYKNIFFIFIYLYFYKTFSTSCSLFLVPKYLHVKSLLKKKYCFFSFVFLIFNLTQISREKRVFSQKKIMHKFVRISAKNVFFSIFFWKFREKRWFFKFFGNSAKFFRFFLKIPRKTVVFHFFFEYSAKTGFFRLYWKFREKRGFFDFFENSVKNVVFLDFFNFCSIFV